MVVGPTRNPDLGPRSLWALIDQRTQKNIRECHTDLRNDKPIMAEFARIASVRFGDGRKFSLQSLYYWGLLWLLLSAVDEAEKTAMAISAFHLRPRNHNRASKIMALKLLAMAATARMPAPALADLANSLYRQLWPGSSVPPEECTDREQIDEMLKRSVPHIT